MREDDEAGQEPKLADFAQIVRRKWIFVSLASLSLGTLITLLSFAIPPTYEGVTTLLPVPGSDRLSALGVIGARLADLNLPASLPTTPAVSYPEILQSRRLMEQALNMTYPLTSNGDSVRLIDLIQPRGEGAKRLERAVKKLRRHVEMRHDRRSGIITIRVKARYPIVAAGVANSLATLLQEFTIDAAMAQAGKKKAFIEGRLVETEAALTQRENGLRDFRERNLRIGNSPRLQVEEGRLVRSLREQEEIYLTLRREYEMAKVEEHRDLAPIIVLDTAIPPASRHSPSRGASALLGLLIGAVGGGVAAIIRDGPRA